MGLCKSCSGPQHFFLFKEKLSMKKTLLPFILLSSLMIISCVSTNQNKDDGTTQEKTPVQSAEKEKQNVSAIHNQLPEGEVELLDGFEEGNFWQAGSLSVEKKDNDRSIDADLSEEWASEGMASLEMKFASLSPMEEAYFFCEGLLDSNWEGASYFVADFNNTLSKSITLYVATKGKKSGEWSRTEEVTLGVGENTNVMFDLKNSITDENGTALPELAESNAIGQAYIVVKGKAPAGSLMADNIRLIR